MNTEIESGLTGEDWEPTAATKFYAQAGDTYAFGATELEAVNTLMALLRRM